MKKFLPVSSIFLFIVHQSERPSQTNNESDKGPKFYLQQFAIITLQVHSIIAQARRKVCSKNSLLAKDIARALILDVDF